MIFIPGSKLLIFRSHLKRESFYCQVMKMKNLRSYILCLPLAIAALFIAVNALNAGDLTKAPGDMQKPIVMSSDEIKSWESEGSRVFVGLNNVSITRGSIEILADECVCWFYEEKALQSDEASLDIYFEGNVSYVSNEKVEKHDQLFLRLETSSGVVVDPGGEGFSGFEDEQESDFLVRAKIVKHEAEKSFRRGKEPVFTMPDSKETVNVFADEVDSWMEGDKRIVTAIGNVKIKRGDVTLDADNVVLWFDKAEDGGIKMSETDFDEIYAEGNVTLRNNGDAQKADSIFINYKESKGLLVNGEIDATFGKVGNLKERRINRGSSGGGHDHDDSEGMTAHIKGDEIKIVGEGQYEIKNGEFTSCGFSHPHYKFKSSKMRIVKNGDQGVVSLAGNKLYWGDRPIFYWPYFSFDIRSKPNVLEEWEVGDSSRHGAFILTNWNLFNLGFAEGLDKWSDLTMSLDYLQKRGPGVGLKYTYDRTDVFGDFDMYYINDKKDEELNSMPVEGEDRWRLSWKHRQFLPYNVRMDIEANNLSDDSFLREFYEDTFKQGKDEETVLYLRRLEDTHAATALMKKQLNSFDTFVDAGKMERVPERLPELGYKVIGEPIWGGRLNYTSENTFTYFDRLFSSAPVEKEPDSVLRFDSNTELSAPFRIAMVKVKPHINGRIVGYSDSAEDKDDPFEKDDGGAGLMRVIGSIGVDMSATMWRTYSFYNELFNINRLRHVFTPEFRYSFNPVITHDPEDINQFDSVDALGDSQWLLLGLRNKLQTKRGKPGSEKTTDLVYFDVELNMFVGDAEGDTVFNNDIVYNRKREDFIQFDFKAQVTENIALVSERNEFNIQNKTFDQLNVGVEVDFNSKLNGFLGQRFIEGVSSSLLLSANYALSDKWEIGFLEQFDFRSRMQKDAEDPEGDDDLGKNLKTRLVLTRYFHEWMGRFTTEFNPVRDETTTRFDVYPRILRKKQKSGRLWF